MRSRPHRLIAWFLLGAVLSAGAGRAEVRVEEDEVIFRIAAPGAAEVFLVGDFNNWNPTLEKMEKTGDAFEVRLFLVPGTYRYKFVVDGTWVTDPDNPAGDAAHGSLLELRERSGMLVLGLEEPTAQAGERRFAPSARYSGSFFLDDGETHSVQSADFYVRYEGEKLRSSADFKTTDESWDVSPLRTEIHFDRGFVGADLGSFSLRGFENDTIWSSEDPFETVGNVGVYRYNAGYERKGFTLETRPLVKTTLRAMLADKFEEPPANASVPASAFGGFAGSSGPDTTVYRSTGSFEDADTWVIELEADAGDLGLGYVRRSNRGLHPGLLVEVVRRPTAYDLRAFNTRETWDADVAWVGYTISERLTLEAAYGYGKAGIEQLAESRDSTAALGEVVIGPSVIPTGARTPLQTSTRWMGGLEYARGSLEARLEHEWNRFEFAPYVVAGSEATVWLSSARARYRSEGLRVEGRLAYRDQDYGRTPADFHVAAPALNFWIDHRDRVDVPEMVEFDRVRFSSAQLSASWDQPTEARLLGIRPAWARLAVRGAAADFFGDLDFFDLRAAVEGALARGVYVQADARWAWYDRAARGLVDIYVDPYVEVGYRNRFVEISLGFGVDPRVLDPVTNEYGDIGREEFLRGALFDALSRDRAAELGGNLRNREESLEEIDALKLELLLVF